MKYLKLFEENLQIGDSTNYGVIKDKVHNQYFINDTWYHHSLVVKAKSDSVSLNSGKIQTSFNKVLVVVDIQPDYFPYFKNLNFKELKKYITSFEKVFFLYNGEKTVGELSKAEYYFWLLDTLKLEERFLDKATFLDKGYGFFRSFMDLGISENDLINLGKYMYKNNINDTRLLDTIPIEIEDPEKLKELMETDSLSIPDFIDHLNYREDIVLIGGGVNECLKEVAYCFDIINKRYQINSKFTY